MQITKRFISLINRQLSVPMLIKIQKELYKKQLNSKDLAHELHYMAAKNLVKYRINLLRKKEHKYEWNY